MRIGLRRYHIGTPELSWHDLRVFIQWLGPDSAYYRARNPKSWPWDANTEFLSAILYVLQWSNFQRAGGQGEKPKMIRRPGSDKLAESKISLDERRKLHNEEIARRAQQQTRRTRRPVKRMESNSGR
jgi:hypothetical protein